MPSRFVSKSLNCKTKINTNSMFLCLSKRQNRRMSSLNDPFSQNFFHEIVNSMNFFSLLSLFVRICYEIQHFVLELLQKQFSRILILCNLRFDDFFSWSDMLIENFDAKYGVQNNSSNGDVTISFISSYFWVYVYLFLNKIVKKNTQEC